MVIFVHRLNYDFTASTTTYEVITIKLGVSKQYLVSTGQDHEEFFVRYE